MMIGNKNISMNCCFESKPYYLKNGLKKPTDFCTIESMWQFVFIVAFNTNTKKTTIK